MSTRRTASIGRTSALDALTWQERASLLEELLAARPELREQAETMARSRLVNEDRAGVADDVESTLRGFDIDELNGRAGYHPGRGYVDPGEAAYEILDEALQPFVDDLTRRGELGMTAAAVELAVGILVGLYACRHTGSESLLEYAADYPGERVADVLERCAKLRLELPDHDLEQLMPEWTRLLIPAPPPAWTRRTTR